MHWQNNTYDNLEDLISTLFWTFFSVHWALSSRGLCEAMPNADISLSFLWAQYWSVLSSLWGIFSDQMDLCVDCHYLMSTSLLGENTKFGFFLTSIKINKENITNHMVQSKNSYWSSSMPSWQSQTFLYPSAGLAHS